MEEVTTKALERATHILGPHSAAAVALADLNRRCDAGEDAAVYLERGTYIVGPRLAPPQQRGRG